MIFGKSRNGAGGFGVPAEEIREAASGTLREVAPGPCVG